VREYLLYCKECNEYTSLGKYLEKEGRFEGEYSLLYNQHLNGDEMLCRFLIGHVGHPLVAAASRTERYSHVLKHAGRFKDGDIDAFLEAELERREQKTNELLTERGLGQLQLYILKEQLKQEAERIAGQAAGSPAEAQFMLGKEEGVKTALAILEDLLKKSEMIYR